MKHKTPKAYKAVTLRLHPNKDQAILFEKNCGCVRYIYNSALDFQIRHYEKTGKYISRYQLSLALPRLKEIHPWLAEIDSTSLQQALANLDVAYKNFFRRVKLGQNPGFS